jgi:hypothetical protein
MLMPVDMQTITVLPAVVLLGKVTVTVAAAAAEPVDPKFC